MLATILEADADAADQLVGASRVRHVRWLHGFELTSMKARGVMRHCCAGPAGRSARADRHPGALCPRPAICSIALMTVSVTIDALAQVPLLSGLDRHSLEKLARALKDRTFRSGEHALDEGKSGVGFFIVLEGSATVSIGGREVRRLGPGDWFGEIALLANDSIRTATVTAETDVKCVGLTAWEFRPFLAEYPDIAWQIMTTMARRITDSSQLGEGV